jgi:HSP20 family protein
MKLDLSQWNPFKFFRKAPEEQAAQSTTSTALAVPGEPEWPTRSEAMRRLMPDPWRLMPDMLQDPLAGFGQLDRWFGDFSPRRFEPRLDVVDQGHSLCLTVELPGMEREDVELTVEDDALVLRGEKKVEAQTEEEGCYRLERAYGRFQRLIPLPDGVDVDKVEATFAKGVLTIQVPKAATAKPRGRRLQITGASYTR